MCMLSNANLQYLSSEHIRTFLYQTLCGLKYMNSASVVHRDMKPANILLNEDCSLKICDFGLARVVAADEQALADMDEAAKKEGGAEHGADGSRTLHRSMTKHVVTRWYRPPELILLQNYSVAVDMWSVGCILAELLSMQKESVSRYQDRVPLFPGKSCFPLSADQPTSYADKLDQLNVIFDVIGTPEEGDIAHLGGVRHYLEKLPRKPPSRLQERYRGAPPEAIDILRRMLHFNPAKRISVDEALRHPYLASVRRVRRETEAQSVIEMEGGDAAKLSRDALKKLVYQEALHYRSDP